MVFEGEKRTTLLRLMILMMMSDREIHIRERELIKDVFPKLTGVDLSDPEMDTEIIAAGEEKRGVVTYLRDLAPELSEAEKELVIKSVFLVGLADGVYRDPEEEILVEIATVLGVSGDRLHEITKELLTLNE